MWGKRESLTAKVQGSRGGFAAIDEEVAAVLAFVISHTTFLAAQDDETGRCPIKNHSRPFLWKGQTSEARRGWHPGE